MRALSIGGRPVAFGPIDSQEAMPLFTWSNVQGAATYQLRVDRTDQIKSNVINIQGLVGTSYTLLAPLPSGEYRYWIKAVSTSGESSYWSLVTTFAVASSDSDDLLLLFSDFSRYLNVVESAKWVPESTESNRADDEEANPDEADKLVTMESV